MVNVAAGRGNRVASAIDQVMSERSIKVPLLIHRPGHERQTIDTPISTMDIAPTVLELTGTPIGPRLQGTSLLSVLNGAKSPRGWAMSRLRRGSSSPGRNWQTALCTPAIKLVMRHGMAGDATPATFKLYDLKTDPLEQQDLAGQASHAAELEHMIDLMLDTRCALEDRTEPRIADF